MTEVKKKTILIIGIGGGLAKLTAGLILKNYSDYKIVGVDSRSINLPSNLGDIVTKRIKYSRNSFEKLFREYKFDVVYHLGRLSHAHSGAKTSLSQRIDANITGTNHLLTLSLQYNVKKVIILSTYHVYGALSDNPVYISEESPLKADFKYPELRDVVEMDQICTNWMWKHQNNIETIIMRPCSIIGPQIKNAMCQYLAASYAPVPIDFNPMFQFIHEYDMANILQLSLEKIPIGIYNVATDEVISLRETKNYISLPTLPVPIFMLEQLAIFINKTIWKFPRYLLDYVKHSCIIDNSALKKHLPKNFFRYSIRESMDHLKSSSGKK